jgi:hypothetical protein
MIVDQTRNDSSIQQQSEIHLMVTLFLTAASFIISWACVAVTVRFQHEIEVMFEEKLRAHFGENDVYKDKFQNSQASFSLCTFIYFALLNSIADPIIFIWRLKDIQEALIPCSGKSKTHIFGASEYSPSILRNTSTRKSSRV